MDAEKVSKEAVLKVVFLAASPLDQHRLRLDKEARDIKEKLNRVADTKVNVEISHEWAVRANELQDILLNGRHDVLQFSGHGGAGTVCFEDETGNTVPVEGAAFAELIKLAGSSIRCVVLNACYSADIAISMVAPVECVIGCDASIDDDAAAEFSTAFYRGIAHGKSYEESFRLGRNAVSVVHGTAEADKYRFRRT